MVTKKTVKKPAVKPATKRIPKAKPELTTEQKLKRVEENLEMAVVGLHMAKASMELMSKKYDELFEAYEQAIKHIRKLEKKAK
jgi:hypothetical protein